MREHHPNTLRGGTVASEMVQPRFAIQRAP
jgi:hypothetical protein